MAEDQVVQTIPEVSPTKWHLAHVTWFFERFCLLEHAPGYQPVDERYHYLFNSYYYTVGEMYRRPHRGLLSRPTVAEIHAFRARVDDAMERLIAERGGDESFAFLVELGLQHEQQHQELMLTDIKHVFFSNPLGPAYAPAALETALEDGRGTLGTLPSEREAATGTKAAWGNAATASTEGGREAADAATVGRGEAADTATLSPAEAAAGAKQATPAAFTERPSGLFEIGAAGSGFCFDNETPRHQVLVYEHALGNRLVTNAEFRDFIRQGGYDDPALWLSDAWALIREEGWRRPLYWSEDLEQEFTLAGWRPIDPAAPVCHVSYYEADAFARWAGARLPTEAEWELAAAEQPIAGNFLDSKRLHPAALTSDDRASPYAVPASSANGAALAQLYGDVWEWTSSPYDAYPGFTPLAGSLGEYNGKFMCNQMVVRGGSCVTWAEHIRATYRSFFYPRDRWQFLGFRLAQNR